MYMGEGSTLMACLPEKRSLAVAMYGFIVVLFPSVVQV